MVLYWWLERDEVSLIRIFQGITAQPVFADRLS